MQELAIQWYATLSSMSNLVAVPFKALADGAQVAPLSALLFGVIGTAAPCQLTTNAGALAYVARTAGDRRSIGSAALAYLLGKALVYTLLGIAVILAGRQLALSSIPVIVVARKALGPLMLLLGLYFLRVLPLRFSIGFGLSRWIEARAGSGAVGAFLLGTAFSFAFCPTLFLLFFGLTLPLALASPFGLAYPGIFALGTTLPLLGIAGLFMAGIGATRGYVGAARRIDTWLRPAAGSVLVLAGLHDTFVYWLL